MLNDLKVDHEAMDILLNLSIIVDEEYPIGASDDTLGTLIIQVLGNAAKHIRREIVPYSAVALLWKERANNDECFVGQNENI